MTDRRRVVITGLGAVTALGLDVATSWAAATQGHTGIRPIAGIPTDRLTVKTAAEVIGFDPAAHFSERQRQMMDRTSQLALVAGREAVTDSQCQGGSAWSDNTRAGIVLGAAIGQETFDSSYKALYGEDAKRLSPMTVPRIMPNAPASHLSMEFGLRGPCFSIASGLLRHPPMRSAWRFT